MTSTELIEFIKNTENVITVISVLATIVTLIISIFAAMYPTIRKLHRRYFGHYPRDIKSTSKLDMGEVLDAVRYGATKIKEWHPQPLILGINRGGCIMGGLIAKHLKHNHIGLVSFHNSNQPEILVPNIEVTKEVVLVDDQVNSGQSAQLAVDKIIELFGANVRILFITLKATADPTKPGPGTGKASITGVERFIWLIDTNADLPWDTKSFNKNFDPSA